jgi:hypothetical protein
MHTYYIHLEPLTHSPSEPFRVFYDPHTTLPETTAYLDEQPVAGSLHFRTFYSLRTRDKAALLLQRMSEAKPYLLGTPFCYGILGLTYVLFLGTLLWQVGRQSEQRHGNGA